MQLYLLLNGIKHSNVGMRKCFYIKKFQYVEFLLYLCSKLHHIPNSIS